MLSMTGFGRGQSKFPGFEITIEISSVNRKQLEVRLNLPGDMTAFEDVSRKKIAEHYTRGSVFLRASITRGSGESTLALDSEYLDLLIQAAGDARKRAGLPVEQLQVELLMGLPGVIRNQAISADDETVKTAYLEALSAACLDCRSMREREGEALRAELSGRSELLQALLTEIESHLPEAAEAVKNRLQEKLLASKLSVDINDPSYLRELLFYADHCDVTEEAVRLKSHFAQLSGYLASDAPCGRNLDFLAQEMFREINTLGNKASSSTISPLVVKFKSELEKLREQIQNVE